MQEIREEATVKLGLKSVRKREEYLDLIDRLLEECYARLGFNTVFGFEVIPRNSIMPKRM